MAVVSFAVIGRTWLTTPNLSLIGQVAFGAARAANPWKCSPGRTMLGGMTDPTPPPYELAVRACTIHAGRYRWDIRESGTAVQSSIESFAARERRTRTVAK